jgi:hypothetical protein
MIFLLRFIIPMIVLSPVTPCFGQLEAGVQVGFVQPRFFYKETKFQQLLYKDDSSYHYSTSFNDKNGQQAGAFIRTKKNGASFAAMLFYQNRQTTSAEQYNYHGTNGSYDPFFTMADTIVDTRSVAAGLHGIYAAVLPGFEVSIGKGKVYLDAGFYLGYIFRSSTHSSGTSQVYNNGNQTTESWTDRTASDALNGADAGIIGGLGFNYPLSSLLCLQVEFRGSRGLVDLGAGDFGWYGIGKINAVNLGLNLGIVWRFE